MDTVDGSILQRAALGHMASVGDLYDARTDNFCGLSIFKKKIPHSALTVLDSDFSDVQLVHSDTFTEKFNKLDVRAELSVSVLAGLFKLEGSARYLNDKKTSARTVKSSLLYKIQTKDESVNIYHEDLKDAFAIDAIENGLATHVVAGISWGANSVLSCLYENHDNKDVKDIEGKLSASLNMAVVRITGSAEVEVEEGEIDKGTQFEVRIYGDVLPKDETLPTTFEEALKLMKQLPKLVSNCNKGKGKPLMYRLIPISLLQNYLNFSIKVDTTLKSLEETSLIRVVQLFDEMAASQQEVHDLYKDAKGHTYCVHPEEIAKISRLKNEMALEETSLRAKLSSVLTEVRSGRKGVSEIEALIQDFQSNPVGPKNVANLLLNWHSVRTKISFAKLLKQNGIKYVGLGSSYDDEVLDDLNSKQIVLFFTQNSKSVDRQRWVQNRQIFFQAVKNKKDGEALKFFAVDCDIHPNLLPKGVSSVVQVVQGGKVIVEDLLEDQTHLENIPYAQALVSERTSQKPNTRSPLCIPCTGITCSPTQQFEWICKGCSEKIEYGFDNFVYCGCGKAPVELLEFKCPDPMHGVSFESHDEKNLKELISNLRPFQELNVLVLGEIGVGKSSWINGFANYLSHDRLADAVAQGDISTPIPSSFTICNGINVSTGDDPNEVPEAGRSTTKDPRVYLFQVGNLAVRLIDTPGLGDARGVEQDKLNLQKVLGTLSHLDELHGICVLLKPNSARVNAMFPLCIDELLKILPKQASKNIVFCFTKTRETFYEPGDSLVALKKLSRESVNVGIAVSPSTVYSFDSEAYLYLAAAKNDLRDQFSEGDVEIYSKSWTKSITEMKRMMKHIKSLTPHPIQFKLNSTEALEFAVKIVPPLVDISQNFALNVAVLEKEKRAILRHSGTVDDLKRRQMGSRIEIEVRRLDHPRRLCVRTSSARSWLWDGLHTHEFAAICNDHSPLTGIISEPQSQLMMVCSAQENGICRMCNKSFKEHLHVYFASAEVVNEVENLGLGESLSLGLSAEKMKEKMVAEKDSMMTGFEEELKEIEKGIVTCVLFVKMNVTPNNDVMIKYLDHLVKLEETKVGSGAFRRKLDSLIGIEKAYLKEKELVEKEIETHGDIAKPSTGDVDLFAKKLQGLKKTGKILRKAVLDSINFGKTNYVYSEKFVRLPIQKTLEETNSRTNWF